MVSFVIYQNALFKFFSQHNLCTLLQERLHQLEKQKQEAEYLKQEKEKLKAEAESSENVALEKYRLIEEQEKKKVAEEEKNAQMQEIFKFFSDIDQNHDEM